MTVDHIDNDKSNNNVDNLQLLTNAENSIKGNAKNWKLINPEGVPVIIYNMEQFCRENKLHAGHMRDVANGKPNYRAHKGWRKNHD